MKRYVLIPAGGAGNRMGMTVPKQFLPLAGKPVLVHTIQKFLSAVPDIDVTVVLPAAYFSVWEKIKEQYFPTLSIQTAEGGTTRFDSVKNGLQLLRGSGVVAIHDAVRPFASVELIRNCFASAEKYGSGVAAVLPKDSILKTGSRKKKKSADNESKNKMLQGRSKDRNNYRLAQTPQTFLLKKIKAAYECKYNPSFTDDASIWEAAGERIFLTEGEYSNFKITTQEDLLAAEAMLLKQ